MQNEMLTATRGRVTHTDSIGRGTWRGHDVWATRYFLAVDDPKPPPPRLVEGDPFPDPWKAGRTVTLALKGSKVPIDFVRLGLDRVMVQPSDNAACYLWSRPDGSNTAARALFVDYAERCLGVIDYEQRDDHNMGPIIGRDAKRIRCVIMPVRLAAFGAWATTT